VLPPLLGGQMVFLHEVERRATDVRPTDDVDVVVDLRAEPAGLTRIHASLSLAGFDQNDPSPEGMAHRYRRAKHLRELRLASKTARSGPPWRERRHQGRAANDR
jgi:hypothetical protein